MNDNILHEINSLKEDVACIKSLFASLFCNDTQRCNYTKLKNRINSNFTQLREEINNMEDSIKQNINLAKDSMLSSIRDTFIDFTGNLEARIRTYFDVFKPKFEVHETLPKAFDLVDHTLIDYVMKRYPDTNIADANSVTPLMRCRTLKGCQLMLEKQYKLGHKDIDGNNELMRFVKSGSHEIVNLLVQNGAEINAMNNSQFSPLCIAAMNGNMDICRLLIEHNADVNCNGIQFEKTPVVRALQRGRTNAVILLLENGFNLARTSKLGKNLLMFAAKLGNYDVCRYLIDSGLNVNIKDKLGFNALQYSIKHKHHEISHLLRSHGAQEVVDNAQRFLHDIVDLITSGSTDSVHDDSETQAEQKEEVPFRFLKHG